MQLYTKTNHSRETADCTRPEDQFFRRLCQLLLCVVVISLVAIAARGTDEVSAWSRERLASIERPRILDKANRYLDELPRTVTADRCERSEGGPHDYYSEGDYWWPNPADPDGTYVQRDGETNPELFYAHRQSLVRLSEIVGTLTSAYLLTDDERYATHAATHLRAWFVDEETFMRPCLLYSQAIPGRCTGRGIGIIDTLHLVEVARSAKFLCDSPALSATDQIQVRAWFREYLTWMNTHEYGKTEKAHNSNHGVCWSLQAATFADLVGDEGMLRWVRNQFKTVYLGEMMDERGGFTNELGRTKPHCYSLFMIDAMAGVAQVASTADDDLWSFELTDGRGMKLGMEFIVPFIQDKSTWPLKPDVMWWDKWPVRHPSLLFAGLHFNRGDYLETWKTLEADPETFEVLRNLPLRHPLLWVTSIEKPSRTSSVQSSVVSLVVSDSAASPEKVAAQELREMLGKAYPRTRFVVTTSAPSSGKAIYLGTPESLPDLRGLVDTRLPKHTEGYLVTHSKVKGADAGIIYGRSPIGVVYGVYGLLEKLGYGFYLSGDTTPAARNSNFTVESWDIVNEPMSDLRIVFNWHNFLSGCSTWGLPQWKQWITQSQKMGYNTIMVHAYGNNPMFTFEFNGMNSRAGYIPTTRRGRDYGSQQVNDVRRLPGGDLFDSAEFGADYAKVPDAERVKRAKAVMQSVFAYAKQRGMRIIFAKDIDTYACNPQELIKSLPEIARTEVRLGRNVYFGRPDGPIWMANPDTPEGYAFYEAQAKALLTDYPQIDTIALWFRGAKVETPLSATGKGCRPVSRVVNAWKKAVAKVSPRSVDIALGSWRREWLVPADQEIEADVSFIMLDYEVIHDNSILATQEGRDLLKEVGSRRNLIPILWAHHDDGKHVGRPFVPIANLTPKLAETESDGFGIIHWMTRPLDIYFKNLGAQVWSDSKDQPLKATCDRAALDYFGNEALGDYLYDWSTTAPMFGRETRPILFDRPILEADAAELIARCQRRLEVLDRESAKSRSVDQQAKLAFFKGMEEFFVAALEAEVAHQRSMKATSSSEEQSRKHIAACRPQDALEIYAGAIRNDGPTTGEKGMLIEMALSWIPYVENQRQVLGLAPCRYNFQEEYREKFGQGLLDCTYHYDLSGNLWRCLGKAATGGEYFELSAAPSGNGIAEHAAEICKTGIRVEKEFRYDVRPMVHDLDAVHVRSLVQRNSLPGRYELQLYFVNVDAEANQQSVFSLTVEPSVEGAGNTVTRQIDCFDIAKRSNVVFQITVPVTLSSPSTFDLTVRPLHGAVYLGGLEVTPVNKAVERTNVFSREAIEEIAERVNRSQLERPWKEEDRNWIRATYYTGVMAMYRATGDHRWLAQAESWAEKHDWQVGNERSGANVLTCVQTYLQLCEQQERAKPIRQVVQWLNSGRPNTPSGADAWYLEADRRYADSLYVGPPALAMLAKATGDPKYLSIMDAMFWDVHRELFDQDAGLFYRDNRFRAQPGDVPVSAAEQLEHRKTWVYTITPNGKKVFWSRGNGWVFAGIARILAYLPEDHPTRSRYVELFQQMAQSLSSRQQPDGAWRMNLDDPDQYPISEASGTGFFTYGFAWGVNHGFLDREEYQDVAMRGWKRLTEMVSPEGKVQWGQPVGGSPFDIRREDSHEYVTGTFLLAASEIFRLVTTGHAGEESRQ